MNGRQMVLDLPHRTALGRDDFLVTQSNRAAVEVIDRFPDWPDRYRVQMQYRGFRRARLSEIVANVSVDQRPELQRVGQHGRPVFVVWGKQDPNVPFEFSASLMELLPQGHLLAVDDSGHLPLWEQPAVVNPAIVAFLRQVNGMPA